CPYTTRTQADSSWTLEKFSVSYVNVKSFSYNGMGGFFIFAIYCKTCDNGENMMDKDDRMTNTIDLQINAKNITDFNKGYPLILKDAVLNPEAIQEGKIVRL